jgi:hypothetical protein
MAIAGSERLTTDPPVSEAQRRAMWAAREGHSTLGIPKSVGEKFVGPGHDSAQAAGMAVVAKDAGLRAEMDDDGRQATLDAMMRFASALK